MEADLLKLSLQAYTSELTHETMKLQGVYKQQLMQILVDSGSANNFLDSALVSKLKVTLDIAKPMDVMVVNGDTV